MEPFDMDMTLSEHRSGVCREYDALCPGANQIFDAQEIREEDLEIAPDEFSLADISLHSPFFASQPSQMLRAPQSASFYNPFQLQYPHPIDAQPNWPVTEPIANSSVSSSSLQELYIPFTPDTTVSSPHKRSLASSDGFIYEDQEPIQPQITIVAANPPKKKTPRQFPHVPMKRGRKPIVRTQEQAKEHLKKQKVRNRTAAAKCRQKKSDEVKDLISSARESERKQRELEDTFDTLRSERLDLLEDIYRHRECGCDAIEGYLRHSYEYLKEDVGASMLREPDQAAQRSSTAAS